MIHFRCANVQCGDLLHADERHGGRHVRCFRCGFTSVCPAISGPRSDQVREVRVWSRSKLAVCFAVLSGALVLMGWLFEDRATPDRQPGWQVERRGQQPPQRPSALNEAKRRNAPATRILSGRATSISLRTGLDPAEAKQSEILRDNAGRPGDPELDTAYQAINDRHFGGALPQVPVIWESRLGEVGPLVAENFTLRGMWGLSDKHQPLILLNPSHKGDRREVNRVLCHEMIHQYLFTMGDTDTNHGPAFAKELRRLLEEGAFQGILATDGEKANLRAWLAGESASLDSRKVLLDEVRRDIDRLQETFNGELDDLNARISRANAQGYDWPSEDEIKSAESRKTVLTHHLEDFNSRVTQHNEDAARFNRQAHRYNLMMSYPDGLDEESVIRPKSTAHRSVQD